MDVLYVDSVRLGEIIAPNAFNLSPLRRRLVKMFRRYGNSHRTVTPIRPTGGHWAEVGTEGAEECL